MEAGAATALGASQFAGVYDYVLRIVRDREVAAGVVRATFANAQTDDVAAVFVAARQRALDALRFRHRRNGAEREALDFVQVDGDRVPDSSVLFDQELVELVWEAAAALPPDEYSLLALQVRHDLAPEVLGEQLGSNGAVSRRLARAREALEERVRLELVLRRARHNCPELDILVQDGAAGTLEQHIRRCARCHESRASFVSPVGVLRGLATIPPDRGLERELFGGPRRRRRFGIL
jgi:DNA-directed RNA polymerase specialized sigma24 family protein